MSTRLLVGASLGLALFVPSMTLSQEWGRPVDVLVMPDGALLVSDDRAGVIYRISYRNP